MAKEFKFRCENKFGDPQKGEPACEIGQKPSPGNQLILSLAELKGQEFPPKCPKCKSSLRPIDKIPPGITGGAGVALPPGVKKPGGSRQGPRIVVSVVALVVGLVLAYWIRGIIAGKPEIAGLPRSVDFGSVEVGSSPTREITVKNKGKGTLKVSQVRSDQSTFQISESKLEIPAGGQKKIRVSYTGGGSGLVTGKLRVVSNDAKFPEVSIALSAEVSDNPWKLLDDYYSKSTIISK